MMKPIEFILINPSIKTTIIYYIIPNKTL